jgi:Ca2+-binding EF-hand superfamily protein
MKLRLALCLCGCLLLGAASTSAQEQKKKRPKDDPQASPAARLLEQFDKNKDGYLDRDEVPERIKGRFDQIDANSDGKLSGEELARVAGRPGLQPADQGAAPAQDFLFRLLDTDRDGKFSKDELQNAAKVLQKLDRNKDGMIDLEELKGPAPKGKGKGGRPGEVNTPAAKGERHKDTVKVGDIAPDFTLPEIKTGGQVTLSKLFAHKPVVLIFASYT